VKAAASATVETTAATTSVATAAALPERSERQNQAKDRTANQGPHTHSPGFSVALPASSGKPLERAAKQGLFCWNRERPAPGLA
jgi:hypothetical protein